MSNSYYATQQGRGTSGQNEITDDAGYPLDANPGERALSPLGRVSDASVANVTLGNKAIGVGAQVGIMRNLEFTAGGRAHRISTGPYTRD